MKRRATTKKPTQAWQQAAPEKKVRHFNQSAAQGYQGKIVLNHNTWVDYDYGVHPPNLTLRTKDQSPPDPNHSNQPNQFSLGKYPTLRKIVTEIPKQAHAKEMDLYLIRDMEETLLWKNGSFEFSN